MKRISEYTDEELMELSEEEIGNIIDLECAYEKVPLLPEHPVAPPQIEIKPDQIGHQVGDYIFLSKEDANAVLSVLQKFDIYEKNYGSCNGEGLRKLNHSPSMKERPFYSEEYFSTIKEEKENYERVKGKYDSLLREYNSIHSDRKSVISTVRDTIQEARDTKGRILDFSKKYLRYMDLANGDKEVAYRFMTDAHPEVEEIENFKTEVMKMVLEENTEES